MVQAELHITFSLMLWSKALYKLGTSLTPCIAPAIDRPSCSFFHCVFIYKVSARQKILDLLAIRHGVQVIKVVILSRSWSCP